MAYTESHRLLVRYPDGSVLSDFTGWADDRDAAEQAYRDAAQKLLRGQSAELVRISSFTVAIHQV